jgi:hypothetical protein
MLAFNPTTGRPGFGRKATQIAIHESEWPKKLRHFKIPTVLFCSNARWLNARILVTFPKRKRPGAQASIRAALDEVLNAHDESQSAAAADGGVGSDDVTEANRQPIRTR